MFTVSQTGPDKVYIHRIQSMGGLAGVRVLRASKVHSLLCIISYEFISQQKCQALTEENIRSLL